ncbi:unnamed protein product (macronuclear) [Paramecium tetraurelia]|uniref:Uncharacterized protein n=1 Tax=Paramecium tetraurelia TaxID=5888 RepID=A0DEL8_PARTE|nr:uncharacterized protein GSPATT00016311001 [Paramecium tetraurelia]CAK81485.1 unnamed protein product [Paramecium tetraurelia]|eukprot:XP_001448882.1 hypothetical protein (macronuclear) [Paramecium tetraurelia strain d4-2]
MFQDIKVSNYNRTIEMYAIVDDRENNNLITSDYILKRIIKSFIHKLNDDDKQLAIKYFLQYFPYNSTLFQIIKEQDAPKSLIKKINYCNDYYGLKQNQKVYEQNEKLQLILFDEDYHKLIKLFDEKEFLENYQIPTLFRQHKHIIEKIKNHSFKLIDLIEQCYDQSFQLNSTILSHLELQISSKEQMELYLLLGEILCECCMQFEYHIELLQFQQQNQNKVKTLSEIPQLLLSPDLEMLKIQMQQVFQIQQFCQKNRQNSINKKKISDKCGLIINRKLLDKNDQIFNFEEIDILIQQQLPVIFELQVIFYQICFYCMAHFNQYYEKYMLASNKVERYKELNLYIQEKSKYNLQQFNQMQFKSYEQYSNEQISNNGEWKTLISQSLDEMLQRIIEDDFHYLNKRLHIIHLNEQNDQRAKIFNLLTEIPVYVKRQVQMISGNYKELKINQIIFLQKLQHLQHPY